MEKLRPRFWETVPLKKMTAPEWEALCDGCGKCCLNKIEYEDTGEVDYTRIACRLLDGESCRCSQYPIRHQFVPDCVRLTPALVDSIEWLPETCAYRLRADGQPLPAWHYLVCGNRDAVHDAGISVRGRAISEELAGPLEQHIILPPGLVWAGDEDDFAPDDADA